MKRILPLSIACIVSTNFAYCENTYGQKSFKRIEDIQTWLQSRGGGGRIQTLKDKSLEIALAQQSYTFGVRSSGLFIFIKRSEGWVEALRLGPYWMTDLTFEQNGDSVTIRQTESKTTILTFSIQALFSQFDHQSIYANVGA